MAMSPCPTDTKYGNTDSFLGFEQIKGESLLSFSFLNSSKSFYLRIGFYLRFTKLLT